MQYSRHREEQIHKFRDKCVSGENNSKASVARVHCKGRISRRQGSKVEKGDRLHGNLDCVNN